MFTFTPPRSAHDHPPHPALDLARRFDGIFATILHHLALVLHLLGPYGLPAWSRLQSARRRVTAILTRLAEGTYPAPRARRPGRKGGPRAPHLPRRRNWLGILAGHQVRSTAGQLRTLLADPAIHHILAQAPPHARRALARSLRTTARLLDTPLPPILDPPAPPPPPRPPRPPRVPRRRPEPISPPIQPYVREAARLTRKRYREP